MNPSQEREVHQNGPISSISALDKLFEVQPLDLKLHAMAVCRYAKLLLKTVAKVHPECALDEQRQTLISEAALFHDVGKIMLPASILYKKESLTTEEWHLIHAHPFLGAKLITLATEEDNEYLHTILDVCRYHHERWDGKGYPYKLCKEDIPFSAQIVGLADVYDALTQPRSYKKGINHTQTVKMILNGECGAFSPLLLGCFSCCSPDLYQALCAQRLENEDAHKF